MDAWPAGAQHPHASNTKYYLPQSLSFSLDQRVTTTMHHDDDDDDHHNNHITPLARGCGWRRPAPRCASSVPDAASQRSRSDADASPTSRTSIKYKNKNHHHLCHQRTHDVGFVVVVVMVIIIIIINIIVWLLCT